MIKRFTILTLAALVISVFMAMPAMAVGEAYTVGGGYWTLPNVDDDGGNIDTNGMYASIALRSINYYIEADYAIEAPNFLCIAADYLYPLSGMGAGMGTAYIGAGYTYFSADDLESESGFNVIGVIDLGESLTGTVRYDFLGSDQEMMTFGISYMFF